MIKRIANRQRRVAGAAMVLVALLAMGCPTFAQEKPAADDLVARYAEIPFSRAEDGGFVLGHPDAPVTIVEFSDFLCPHCQDYEEVVQQFIAEYVAAGKARFEYRMFPIVDPLNSPYMAQVAECADTLKAGMFWPAHDLLFEFGRDRQVVDVVTTLSARLGLDSGLMAACTQDARQHLVDTELGQDMGVEGTPAVMVRMGAGSPQWIQVDGQRLDRGGVPLEVLAAFVDGAANVSTVAPDHLLDDRMLSDSSLVTGEPCAAPCWRGITPGQTTWEDGLAILHEDASLSDVQEQELQSGAIRAIWQPVGGRLCCYIYSGDRETVSLILLQTAPGVTLGQVIEIHGDPTYVIPNEVTPRQALMNLFYPDVPMIVRVFVAGAKAGQLAETSEVIGVIYMTPLDMELIMKDNDLHAWQGYQSFQVYAASAFEVTAEP